MLALVEGKVMERLQKIDDDGLDPGRVGPVAYIVEAAACAPTEAAAQAS